MALADNNQASLIVIGVIDKIPAHLKQDKLVLSPEEHQAYVIAEHLKKL